jgi:hypothetical protein
LAGRGNEFRGGLGGSDDDAGKDRVVCISNEVAIILRMMNMAVNRYSIYTKWDR